MTEVLFLGTGAGMPSRSRSLPCVALKNGSDIVMFDCGEGAQRQMMISPFSFMKIKSIFITHLHGDHILGIPGLLQTMGMSGRTKELVIGGPAGITDSVRYMLASCERTYVEKESDPLNELEFPLKVIEMEHGSEVRFNSYSVSAFRTDHSVSMSLGFIYKQDDRPGKFNKEKAKELGLKQEEFLSLRKGNIIRGITPDMIIGSVRPGCKIVYTGDTATTSVVTEAAEDADLLIHESTYAGSESELAKNYKHSTSVEAAQCAKDANAKMLALVHISNRYDDAEILRKQASAVFENTIAPSDLDLIKIQERIR